MNRVLYSKFGYDVMLLERRHGIEIFRLLEPARMNRSKRTVYEYSKDRRELKGEIRFALHEPRYNSVGIFKDDVLVGISFSNINEDDKSPWLGYFYIAPGSRNSKASVVLINYIVNHLYKGVIVQIGNTNDFEYKKLIRSFPGPLDFAVFKKGVAERFAKICGESEKIE